MTMDSNPQQEEGGPSTGALISGAEPCQDPSLSPAPVESPPSLSSADLKSILEFVMGEGEGPSVEQAPVQEPVQEPREAPLGYREQKSIYKDFNKQLKVLFKDGNIPLEAFQARGGLKDFNSFVGGLTEGKTIEEVKALGDALHAKRYDNQDVRKILQQAAQWINPE